MPAPNDALVFKSGVQILASDGERMRVSDGLAELLVQAREAYAWPKERTSKESRKRVAELELRVEGLAAHLNSRNAQLILGEVSDWGGNNARAQEAISSASPARCREFERTITELCHTSQRRSALRGLADQPGIDLVMATKVYRFCVPNVGAAVDRHCSYFFNSLLDRRVPSALTGCTQFRRQWADGKHRSTRLATYTQSGREWNLDCYLSAYLPLLAGIADSLNRTVGGLLCAATDVRRSWRPADVEMAAYQWWSRNGPS